jgi:hypothetical protein
MTDCDWTEGKYVDDPFGCEELEPLPPDQIVSPRAIKRLEKIYARRAWGEKTLAGILGDLEPGANINTNPRTENATVTISSEMFRFYKDFFDGIKSFDRTFDEWEKWNG